mmetsp:Transcript_5562/g.13420  ORF Transcript_5562/g.13420 Transcript_5562/m.13420 type:complete len:211 (-) Transcript_5562:205-837(-)
MCLIQHMTISVNSAVLALGFTRSLPFWWRIRVGCLLGTLFFGGGTCCLLSAFCTLPLRLLFTSHSRRRHAGQRLREHLLLTFASMLSFSSTSCSSSRPLTIVSTRKARSFFSKITAQSPNSISVQHSSWMLLLNSPCLAHTSLAFGPTWILPLPLSFRSSLFFAWLASTGLVASRQHSLAGSSSQTSSSRRSSSCFLWLGCATIRRAFGF